MTVQEALAKYKTKVILHKKHEEAAQTMLKPGEEVLWATDTVVVPGLGHPEPKEYKDYLASPGRLAGTLVITKQRVFFCSNGIEKAQRQLALQDIQQLAYRCQRGTGYLQIRSLTDAINIYEVEKRLLTGKAILEELLEQRNRPHPGPKTTVPGVEELREWKSLLDDGIITQAEFDAKKKQILGL